MDLQFVIDAGNTAVKTGVFSGTDLVEACVTKKDFKKELLRLVSIYGKPSGCMVSSVSLKEHELRAELMPLLPARIIFLRSGLLLPVKVRYKTPETLGNDRLANACAAATLFPDTNCLVADAGTCLKFDLVTRTGDYLGGGISPGLYMRYKALSHFTRNLPLFKPDNGNPDLVGQSTEASIRSGVENGMAAELDGMIQKYSQYFDSLKVILTGGDHVKFERKVKSPIFVAPNLTLTGLKAILDCNDKTQ
jgi:type III pantothenate kinase